VAQSALQVTFQNKSRIVALPGESDSTIRGYSDVRAYSDEIVQRFRGYSSTISNLKSSTRSNRFRPATGASATARLFLLRLV